MSKTLGPCPKSPTYVATPLRSAFYIVNGGNTPAGRNFITHGHLAVSFELPVGRGGQVAVGMPMLDTTLTATPKLPQPHP
ncbi:MAG TPA: hypothetical protein VIX17_01385 [Pyrinomonadaceae bacterium]